MESLVATFRIVKTRNELYKKFTHLLTEINFRHLLSWSKLIFKTIDLSNVALLKTPLSMK